MLFIKKMQILSETAQKTLKKLVIDTFGSYIRGIFVSALIFILGGVAGAFVIANSIDPRVSAVENKQVGLEEDFDEAYSNVQARLKILEDAKLETSVQVQMLILYQIPASEREQLREEAEKQLETKIDLDANNKN